MHPDMNLRLAQLRIDDMAERAAGRRPRSTVRRWRRRHTSPPPIAPAPLVRLRPPRPSAPDGVAGSDDRRAA